MKRRAVTLPINIRFNQQAERDLQLIPHAELEKFKHGLADEVSINTLAFRLNMGYTLAADLFESPAITEAMQAALNALRQVIDRHQRTGKVGANGEEFRLLGEGLMFTDDMQLKCTRRELDATMKKIIAIAGKK